MITPKIFPSDLSHSKSSSDCNGIIQAVGTAVDSTGLLWVIDQGSKYCLPKLLVFDLMKNEEVCLCPQFISVKFVTLTVFCRFIDINLRYDDMLLLRLKGDQLIVKTAEDDQMYKHLSHSTMLTT